MTITNTNFINISISEEFELISINNQEIPYNSIYFENFTFINITHLYSQTPCFMLNISNVNVISLKNGIIFVNFADFLMNFLNITNVTLEDLQFERNLVNSQVINLEKITYLSIYSLNCLYNNNNHQNLMNGGCIRTMNIFYRKIINLTITNSSSYQTTPGLKIIDTDIIYSQETPYVIYIDKYI